MMKVLLVCDNFYGIGNGLATSARVTTKYLREAGVDVRVLSKENDDPHGPQPDYPLEKFHIPVFQGLVESFGYCFPKCDRAVIKEALEWCDVVHFESAFPLEWLAANLAVKMKKPRVATYHLHPENITFQIGMKNWHLLNHTLLCIFRNVVFDKCTDIQCPTENVRERLERYHFKAQKHVISNGILLDDNAVSNVSAKEPYLVTCVGRLTREKDQFTLLRAMKYSRHAGEIQLLFAGKGVKERRYRRIAARLQARGVLKYAPEFAYLTPDALKELARRSYLNVHCAVIEVEGLSCIEFIREGAVPVIAEGKLSATAQFALDDRSRFPAKDARALAQRIDWWIEHPEERLKMGPEYMESARKYEIHKSIDSLVEMYRTAIEKQK